MTGSRSFLPFAMAIAGIAVFSAMDAVMKGASLAAGVYSAVVLRNTIGALRQVQARILGVVLNRVEGSQHGYYYAYHKSYGNRYYATPYSARKQKPVKRTGVSTPPATRPSTNGAGATPAAEPSKQMKS